MLAKGSAADGSLEGRVVERRSFGPACSLRNTSGAWRPLPAPLPLAESIRATPSRTSDGAGTDRNQLPAGLLEDGQSGNARLRLASASCWYARLGWKSANYLDVALQSSCRDDCQRSNRPHDEKHYL
jgi:hypothetical protein